MALAVSYRKHTLKFNFRVQTSRGSLREKDSFFIFISSSDNPDVIGIGESGPLKGLSIDFLPDLEERIEEICKSFNGLNVPTDMSGAYDLINELIPHEYPSVRFAFEVAFLDLFNGGIKTIFNNSFLNEEPIPINGLIWMGDLEFMLTQITDKIALGFDCIKVKIGSLDFDRECDIIEYIRRKYFNQEITIRLDANGAFKPETAMMKLERLSNYDIHSIEQPIPAGRPDEMHSICKRSPIAIALDEELIRVHEFDQKVDLLQFIKPQYIILKPTLLGGFQSCKEWIELAQSQNIGWWMTSALESNIGLNAICQFTAEHEISIPQGLGTGQIYENNIAAPLVVENANIRLNKSINWDTSILEQEIDDETGDPPVIP